MKEALEVRTAYAFGLGDGIGYAYVRSGSISFMNGTKPFADAKSLAGSLVLDAINIHYHQPRTALFAGVPDDIREAHEKSELADYVLRELDPAEVKGIFGAHKRLENQREAVGPMRMQLPDLKYIA